MPPPVRTGCHSSNPRCALGRPPSRRDDRVCVAACHVGGCATLRCRVGSRSVARVELRTGPAPRAGASGDRGLMAIFHLSVKTVGRSRGRSATAAAAYRAAARIEDERTGLIHDYSRKGGVLYREIVTPDDAPAWVRDRAQLWNAAELAENRKNSTVAREFEVA